MNGWTKNTLIHTHIHQRRSAVVHIFHAGPSSQGCRDGGKEGSNGEDSLHGGLLGVAQSVFVLGLDSELVETSSLDSGDIVYIASG